MYTVLTLTYEAHHFPFVLLVTATTVEQCCLQHRYKPVVVPFILGGNWKKLTGSFLSVLPRSLKQIQAKLICLIGIQTSDRT